MKQKGSDVYGQYSFYHGCSVGPDLQKLVPHLLRKAYLKAANYIFFFYVALLARRFDVVHIHDNQWFLYLLLPFKKKVLEFHGTDLRVGPTRGKKGKYNRRFLRAFAHVATCLVSTPDLLFDLPSAVLLHNPVDTTHFKHRKQCGCGSVYFRQWYENPMCNSETDIVERNLLYKDVPEFLARYNTVIDRYLIHSLSKTALEALAVGLTVVDWKGQVHNGLPAKHQPLNVAKESVNVYKKLLEKQK